jgi:predicted dehydrogenase
MVCEPRGRIADAIPTRCAGAGPTCLECLLATATIAAIGIDDVTVHTQRADREKAMKVLIIGLGDIAGKAYLPVLTAMPELELHFVTRDPRRLAFLAQRYGPAGLHTDVADALTSGAYDAAFVHAATAAHASLVELLLRSGVPVFVDKPLADSFDAAAGVVNVAQEQGKLLMVGFNRRYAPDYAALREQPRELLLMQKHRRAQPDEPRRTVFDDYIHVLDTLRFLAPGPVERTTIETTVREGLLQSVAVMLAGDGFHAIGTMHRASGMDEERLDVVGGGERRTVLNLSERVCARDGVEEHRRRGDWTPVGHQRGFEAMCGDFLQAVREGRATAADDILATHRLCEAVVADAERTRRG